MVRNIYSTAPFNKYKDNLIVLDNAGSHNNQLRCFIIKYQ